jgi:hypothetical protein
MKGILFTQEMITDIVREVNPKIVTRRLGGLKYINEQPNYWRLDVLLDNDVACFLPKGSRDPINLVFIKPRYHAGEVVYIKEAWAVAKEFDSLSPTMLSPDTDVWFKNELGGDFVGRWRSPLHLRADFARYFIKILDVRPERLRLPLAVKELEREGGEPALIMLQKIDGKWVFRYEFTPESSPTGGSR